VKKLLVVAAIVVGFANPALAGVAWNGTKFNGLTQNGTNLNGTNLNGLTQNDKFTELSRSDQSYCQNLEVGGETTVCSFDIVGVELPR
jgi:hypothetical protein